MHVQLRAPSSHLWHRWGSGLAHKTRNLGIYNIMIVFVCISNFASTLLVFSQQQ